MGLSRLQKALLGAATLALPVLAVVVIVLVQRMPVPLPGDIVGLQTYTFGRMAAVLFFSAAQIGLLVVYVRLVTRLNRSSDKTLWLIAVVAAGVLGELVFFFMKVLPRPTAELGQDVASASAN